MDGRRLRHEAERMRRVPGVVFEDGPSGRAARLAGTGLAVWEVIQGYEEVGRDWRRLLASFPWLTGEQFLTALAYAETYPDEIAARLAEEGPIAREANAIPS
jgi:uncharacterized protein (DUF433 family)